MRLDKFVAQAAQLTRTEARTVIRRGEVTVDGVVCKKADCAVKEEQGVHWAGKSLVLVSHIYLMLDKPKGVVSASRDRSDVTVVDLVKDAYPRRELFPAGRLDKTSTGFVLVTDDGVFAHDILSPRRHVSKTYEVELDTPVTQEMIRGFDQGVRLADGEIMMPAGLTLGKNGPCSAVVELRQGVYHQIKRMFGVYGAGVCELRRVAIGGLSLDPKLGPGGFREITQEELEKITAVRLQSFQKNNTTVL